MDPLRQQQHQVRQQQQQQREMTPAFQQAKDQARQIGAIGQSIANLTNALIEVDPEQWALNVQSLNHRIQEVSKFFQQRLEQYVRETLTPQNGVEQYAETATQRR